MKRSQKIYTALIYLFLYAPILVLIVFSFNTSNSSMSMDGFTLHGYRELFRSGHLLRLLGNTLILAVVSSVVATLLGTMAAVGIHGMRGRLRQIVLTVTNIPMTNPEIVTGVSLAMLFVFFGSWMRHNNILGFWTLLIAHVTFNLPYVILSVLPKLRQMDSNLTDAALDLGCTPTSAFFRVTLPEIMPGVVSGMAMAFTLLLDDFVISYFVSGTSFVTLPVEIYNYVKKPIPTSVYALFTLLFLGILLLLVMQNVLEARSERKRMAAQTL